MTSSEDTQVRRLLQETPEVQLPEWAEIVSEADRRRSRVTRTAALAGLAVIIVGIVTVLVWRDQGDDKRVAQQPDEDIQTTDPTTSQAGVEATWEPYEFRPPLTGNQGPASSLSADGFVLAISDRGVALYDTSSRNAVDLQGFPVPASEDTEIGWDGRRFIAFLDERDATRLVNSVYAIDPADGTWMQIDKPAGLEANPTFAVWTGTNLVIGGSQLAPSDRIYSFDPISGTWTDLPSLPIPATQARAAWTGEQLVVLATDVTATTSGRLVALAGVPDGSPWAALPAPAVSERAFTLAAASDGVHLVDYLLGHVVLRDGEWLEAASPMPEIQPAECSPHLRVVDDILWLDYCGALIALRPGGRWQAVNPGPGADVSSMIVLVDAAQPGGDSLFALIGNQLNRLGGAAD